MCETTEAVLVACCRYPACATPLHRADQSDKKCKSFVYVVVKRVVPDPEKASMLWPLEALTITEHTGLTRKVTFLSLFPSQPELCFQIPFISFSLTGRDRRAALERSLQNWCPAAFCTFTAFIFGGMVLSGSSGDRVDPGADSPGCGRAEGCEQVTK